MYYDVWRSCLPAKPSCQQWKEKKSGFFFFSFANLSTQLNIENRKDRMEGRKWINHRDFDFRVLSFKQASMHDEKRSVFNSDAVFNSVFF